MIEISNLTKRYGEQVVVDSVSLRVEAGETLVLLGGSGSGKTTTLKMVNRLVEPTAGRIVVAGQDVTHGPPHELRRRIGYVFQRLGLFPHLTVAENIGITPKLIGWDEPRIRARVHTLLELVELDPTLFAPRRPHELSGGQAQRVAVARALAAEPPVLLFDEPFGALDPMTRERLQASFCELRKKIGFTSMFVTHDMLEAMALGDRVGVMKSGKLLQVGTVGELAANPADPYVKEIVSTPIRQASLVSEKLAGVAL
jgi:osmoprotectant transport system ATP-binding protein